MSSGRVWFAGAGKEGSGWWQSVACWPSIRTPRPEQGLEGAARAFFWAGSRLLGAGLWICSLGGGSLGDWASQSKHWGPGKKPWSLCHWG